MSHTISLERLLCMSGFNLNLHLNPGGSVAWHQLQGHADPEAGDLCVSRTRSLDAAWAEGLGRSSQVMSLPSHQDPGWEQACRNAGSFSRRALCNARCKVRRRKGRRSSPADLLQPRCSTTPGSRRVTHGMC